MQLKAYRAATTQKHGGRVFLAGDTIPAEYIPPFAAARLLKMGTITETLIEKAEYNTGERLFPFPYVHDGTDEDKDVSEGILYFALKALQKNADDAQEMINRCEDTEKLNILYVLDSRKSVKTVIEKRLKNLGGEK